MDIVLIIISAIAVGIVIGIWAQQASDKLGDMPWRRRDKNDLSDFFDV